MGVSKLKKLKNNSKMEIEPVVSDNEKQVEVDNKASETVLDIKSNQLVISIDQRYREIEKQGIIIKDIHELINKAREAHDRNDFNEAISISNNILSIMEETVQVFMLATDLINHAEMKIQIAQSFEAETAEAEKYLNDARVKMEAIEYSKAHKLAQESIKVSESAKDEQIDKFKHNADGLLKLLGNDIFELKKLGASSGKAEFILKKINANIKKNDYKSAFDYIGNFQAATVESKAQHQDAMDKLSSSKQILIDARDSGADISKAKQNWMIAETAMKKHDYESMESLLGTAENFAERALEEHRRMMGDKDIAEEILGTAKSLVNEANDLMIEVSNFKDVLEKGEEALIESNYEFAQKMGSQIIDPIKEIIEQYKKAQEIIQKAENEITESKTLLDTSDAEELLKKIYDDIEMGNYREGMKYARIVIENIDYIKKNENPRINLTIPDAPELPIGTWRKVTLELSNEGKVNAKDIKTTVSENVESRALYTIPDLEAGKSTTIEIHLRTNEAGEIPVTFKVTFLNFITDEVLDIKEVILIKTKQVEDTKVFEDELKEPKEGSQESEKEIKQDEEKKSDSEDKMDSE